VDPEITINVNLPSDSAGAVTAGRVESASAAPPPMPLDQLQSVAATSAPSPAEPGALQVSAASIAADAGPPLPPMEIDRLQATMAPDAPEPVSFGALADVSAAPAPSLQALDVAAAGDAPAPMPIEELESEANGGKGGRKK